MTHQELLIRWLKNTYSLELVVIETLTEHLKKARGYPAIQLGIKKHLEMANAQAGRLEGCIKRLENPVKKEGDGLGKSAELLASAEKAKGDQIVRDMVVDFGLGCLEIASYKTLISLALHFGDQETVSVCKKFLDQEKNIAKTLDKTLPTVIQEYIHRENPNED